MSKKVILASLMAMVMLLSGCALIEKDEAVDAATVIITVGDTTFTKAQVQNQIINTYYQNSQLYSQFGMTYPESKAQTDAIDGMIRREVLLQKAKELGMDQLTDEEKDQVEETAESYRDSDLESIKAQNLADSGLEGDELTAAAEKVLADAGVTLELYRENAEKNLWLEKLEAATVADVTVSDQEIQAEFDSRVESAKTNYETSPNGYGASVNAGSTVYFAPAGYRYVKQIMRSFTEADQTAISDLNTQLTSVNSQLSTLAASLSQLGEETEESREQRSALTQQQAEAEAQKADIEAKLTAAKETAYANLEAKMAEISAKVTAGEDFDALIAAYGEDTGMLASPKKENGYAVCASSTSPSAEFVAAAMALASVGDTSEPVKLSNGMSILKYVGDVAEGPVALDTVKESLSASLLNTKKNETYEAQISAWIEAAGAKVDYKALEN